MKSWNELTHIERAVISILLVIAASLLPEIAILVNLGGAELAFALILSCLTPFTTWALRQLQAVKNILFMAHLAFCQSASVKPSVFGLQASFCIVAFAIMGSGVIAIGFFMPAMLFNGSLA